jgi:hypothetical protein
MTVGPDGAVYIADWCDIRMDHTDPRDTWDKSCGRVWRLRAKVPGRCAPFNLAERWSSRDLMNLLGDDRKMVPRAGTKAPRRTPRACARAGAAATGARPARGQLALEALWTANLIAGVDPGWATALLTTPMRAVRVRGRCACSDAAGSAPPLHDRLIRLARTEPDVEVRSELAATAGRLEVPSGARRAARS